VRASARIEVARRDGRDVLVDARSQPPLAVRDTADRILLVGSAASPVGGDALEIEVVVGAGATAVIGSVAATSIFPGPHAERSRLDTNVAVAGGGRLLWWPEPLLSIAGSNHRSTTRVGLVAGARCTIVEEVSLGRSGQPSGTLELDLRVERAGVPIVHHVERFGPDEPGTGSSVGVADARHVISGVVVGVDPGMARTRIDLHARGAWLPVAADAAMVLVTASDRPSALRLLAELRPCLRPATLGV
jgi:urease accessory protein